MTVKKIRGNPAGSTAYSKNGASVVESMVNHDVPVDSGDGNSNSFCKTDTGDAIRQV